jgi:hypothetical protein
MSDVVGGVPAGEEEARAEEAQAPRQGQGVNHASGVPAQPSGSGVDVMAQEAVRVLDTKTNKITTIPACELAEGMIRARVDGIEGEVFVDAKTLRKETTFRHPPFDEKVRDLLREFAEALADVYPTTVEQWEDGFRRDMNPEKEIGIWVNIVSCYRHFTEVKVSDPAKKNDIFQLILACVNNGPERALATVTLKSLSRKRAAQIVAEIASRGKAKGE